MDSILKKLVLGTAWYGSCLLIIIKMVGETIMRPIFDQATVEAILSALVVLAIFGLVHLCVRELISLSDGLGDDEAEDGAFPSIATKAVASWLIVMSLASLIAVFIGLWLHGGPPEIKAGLAYFSSATNTQLIEAFIAMSAASVGSCVTTVAAYIRHASAKKDFEVAFVPWYLARPIMGVLLGLIFYFVVRGGLIVLVEPGDASQTIDTLNPWGVAGLGALVGMFSKQAIEKLREVFNTMFKTQEHHSPDPQPSPKPLQNNGNPGGQE